MLSRAATVAEELEDCCALQVVFFHSWQFMKVAPHLWQNVGNAGSKY